MAIFLKDITRWQVNYIRHLPSQGRQQSIFTEMNSYVLMLAFPAYGHLANSIIQTHILFHFLLGHPCIISPDTKVLILWWRIYTNEHLGLHTVAHACNPSTSGG